MIYADNAATTKLDKTAFEAMLPWLFEEYPESVKLEFYICQQTL